MHVCVGVFQALTDSQRAGDSVEHEPRAESSPSSHMPWHVHPPTNETDDAKVQIAQSVVLYLVKGTVIYFFSTL